MQIIDDIDTISSSVDDDNSQSKRVGFANGATYSFHQAGIGGMPKNEAHFRYYADPDKGVNRVIRDIWNEREKGSPEDLRDRLNMHFNNEFEKLAQRYTYEEVDIEGDYIPQSLMFDIDFISELRANFEKDDYAKKFIDVLGNYLNLSVSPRDINFEGKNHPFKTTHAEIVINQFREGFLHSEESDIKELVNWFEEKLNLIAPNTFRIDIFEKLTQDKLFELIDMAKADGCKAFRLSHEWSMFTDKNSEDYMQTLSAAIQRIKDSGMTAVLGMHHFTYPVGIGEPHSPDFVQNYMNFILNSLDKLKELNAMPDDIILFNEPLAFIPQGYITGDWPPFQHNLINFRRAFVNTQRAYIETFDAVKQKFGEDIKRVGFAENLPALAPKNPNNWIDRQAVKLYKKASMLWADGIFKESRRQGRFLFDFIGLQNYGGHVLDLIHPPSANPGEQHGNDKYYETSSNGWIINPEAMAGFAMRLNSEIIKLGNQIRSLDLPTVYITEYGIAHLTDPKPLIDLIDNGIELASSLIPRGIEMALRWSPAINTPEWRMFTSLNSGFGDRGYLAKMNERKPASKKKVRELNKTHPDIIREVEKMIEVLDQRQDLLTILMIQNKPGQVEFDLNEESLAKLRIYNSQNNPKVRNREG